MIKIQLTQELVKSLFDYKDGFLYWKIRPANCVQIGDKAFSYSKRRSGDKYCTIIYYKNYLHSRIVFLWHKGYLPKMVDHKNRITLDDRIENLRETTSSQNMYNKTSHKNSTSQYLGVYKRGNSWRATIRVTIDNKPLKLNLGTFNIEKEAALAYNKEASKYHKEFANLNIID